MQKSKTKSFCTLSQKELLLMVWCVCICLHNTYFHINIVLKFAFTNLLWKPFCHYIQKYFSLLNCRVVVLERWGPKVGTRSVLSSFSPFHTGWQRILFLFSIAEEQSPQNLVTYVFLPFPRTASVFLLPISTDSLSAAVFSRVHLMTPTND